MNLPPEDNEDGADYSHVHDAQAGRSRIELVIIVVLVLVILVGSLIWRATTGARPGPPRGYGPSQPPANSQSVTPGAGAGVVPRPV